MITRKQYWEAKKRTVEFLKNAGIHITKTEKKHIEVVDFGLGDLYNLGVEIIVYVNTQKVCAKELILFPRQTCAEHIHPSTGDIPGKEETFRCRWGKVFLYISGPAKSNIKASIPKIMEGGVSVFHEIILNPGEQYTLHPDTLHWFQAGPDGAIVSEFSTQNTDEFDTFTDSRINRFTDII